MATFNLLLATLQSFAFKHLARLTLLTWIQVAIPLCRWHRFPPHTQGMACQNLSLTTLLNLSQKNWQCLPHAEPRASPDSCEAGTAGDPDFLDEGPGERAPTTCALGTCVKRRTPSSTSGC
eukprot:6492568-Amphidinium_carterae.2